MSTLSLVVRRGFVVIIMVSAICPGARAALSVIGDVTAANNGIPVTPYEFITPSELDTELPPGTPQTTWEENRDIIVGVKLLQGGRMDIDGTTQLRYQDLIIGSKGIITGTTFERKGSGTVLITGNGALYSNDPTSFPPELEGNPNFNFSGPDARDPAEGYDVIVGQWGQGRLELRNGGRAEIQDAVVVGDEPGSTGVITVDGFGTLLANGGFEADTGGAAEPHQMIVGRQGVGQMYITNGALVYSEGPTTGEDIVGAVIGSDAFVDNTEPELGGTGIVTVSGVASRWAIGGSLQIGGYHNSTLGALPDPDGTNVDYNGPNGQPGRGTLIVETGSLVKVSHSISITDPDNEDLLMAIGYFGTLDLRGGLVDIGDGDGTDSTTSRVQVSNDGVISGYGRIQTGSFNNRYFGRVRVGVGQSLVIDSKSEFTSAAGDVYPLINFGLIEVIGTPELPAELEFVRPPAGQLGSNDLIPLINRPVELTDAPAPTTFDGGLISAQNARLRFTSGPNDPAAAAIGMQNEGTMAFTAGTNIISGNVVNIKGAGATTLNPKFIIGPNTTVVVEDDFTVDAAVIGPGPGFVVSGPIIDLGQGATLIVLDQSTLTLAGALNMDLGLTNSSSIEASGDVGLGGVLNVSLGSDILNSFAGLPGNGHGSAFEILSFAGQAFGVIDVNGVSQPNPAAPIPEGISSPFSQVNIAPDLSALFPDLDAVVQRIDQGIYLSFLDPTLVGGGAMGSDFNGDGVVDQADLAIWKANKGITTGASVLQGDADGDGDVDGADYLIWLEKFTNGGVPGGSPAPAGSVPEPAGMAMLSMAAMLALAFRRRRG